MCRRGLGRKSCCVGFNPPDSSALGYDGLTSHVTFKVQVKDQASESIGRTVMLKGLRRLAVAFVRGLPSTSVGRQGLPSGSQKAARLSVGSVL